ncbi:hypothetical protein O9K51_05194 [Purpureocillium lavendulum]|uniref:Uncharacterized protein n=1 Tax=Purpureocillium lavendulum TaxID=1247861 RepID=A0AB34FQ33_9HYPO|nr:hypothetical protein O9K51_05194 [Purpureocillium lavendulum]
MGPESACRGEWSQEHGFKAMLMGTHTGMGMGAGMGMSMGMGTPADEFELGSHGLRALPPCSRSVQSRRLHHG